MDRSDQSPIEGEILKLPHNEGLFDAIQARGGIIQLHSPQPGAQPSINRLQPYCLPHSSGMVLPAATKPRPLILARTLPRSPDTTCLGSAEILQVDYAARKWPGITWLLDHMSYPYPPGDMSAGADLGKHNVYPEAVYPEARGLCCPHNLSNDRADRQGQLGGLSARARPCAPPEHHVRLTPAGLLGRVALL